jgi:hypothetical protein
LELSLRTHQVLITTLASYLLVACGGSGGGGSTQTLGNFSITGTAATGAAISIGRVEARCKNGLGSTTTNYDGTFTVDISKGSLPCILKAIDPISKLQLHSVIEDGESKANISPLTELVAANVLGDSPEKVFANFISDTQVKISSDRIANSVAKVQAATAAIGSDADITGIDFMKGTFRAKTELAEGDATDKKIDALMAMLAAADKKVSDLTNLFKVSTSTNEVVSGLPSIVRNSVYSLANCPNARSGDVWVFGIIGGAPLAYTADFKNMRLTKKITNSSFEIKQVFDSSGRTIPCAYSSTIGGVHYEYRTSDGGLTIAYSPSGGVLIIPAQKNHQLNDASFAGTYPAMAFIRGKTTNLRFALPIRFEIDSNGKLTGYSCNLSKPIPDCSSSVDNNDKEEVTCIASQEGTYSCSSATTGLNATAALYVTGSQVTVLMSVTNMNVGNSSYEGMIVMTKASKVSLPSVGMITPAGATWNIASNNSTISTSYSFESSVTAINLTNNSFTSKTIIPVRTSSVGTSNNSFASTAVATEQTILISEHYLDTPAIGLTYSKNNTSTSVAFTSPSGRPIASTSSTRTLESYDSLQLKSPSGWSVSAHKMVGSTDYSNMSASIRVVR